MTWPHPHINDYKYFVFGIRADKKMGKFANWMFFLHLHFLFASLKLGCSNEYEEPHIFFGSEFELEVVMEDLYQIF